MAHPRTTGIGKAPPELRNKTGVDSYKADAVLRAEAEKAGYEYVPHGSPLVPGKGYDPVDVATTSRGTRRPSATR